MDDFRKQLLRSLFGSIEEDAPSYTFTEPSEKSTLTLASLEQAMAQLENLKKLEDTRQKLASGDYDGVIRREEAEESGLPIERDDNEREYIQVLETKFYIAPYCPAEKAYMLPKAKFGWFSPDETIDLPISLEWRYSGIYGGKSSYTDPTI